MIDAGFVSTGFISSAFDIFLNKLVGISLLLTILLAVRHFVLKYLNAAVAYGMWIIIPVFLLLPIDLVNAENTSSVITIILGENPLNPSTINQQFFENDLVRSGFFLIWLLGIAISMTVYFYRFKMLTASLSKFELKRSNHDLETSYDLKFSKINIVNSHLVNVPAIFGLFKSNLILPSRFSDLPLVNQSMILRHELYHLKRNDHRINIVRLVIKSIFWFNPLVLIADKYCEADQEISCDLGVLQGSPKEERKQYAKALIESASMGSQNKLVSQWKYHSLIKERVKMLKNINTKAWHKWVAIVFSVSAIWLINGVVLAENKDNRVEPTPTSIVKARYPRKAAMENVEGWVKFKFDVDNNGKPVNVVLTDAEPRRIFERDARRAIYKWSFENNKGQKGLVYTMEFKLD